MVIAQKDQKKNLIKGTKSEGTVVSNPKGSIMNHSKRLLRNMVKEMSWEAER
tara:strand:- start:1055 stop:1210 length:156 start_codon:yes stop_codon:yes gene_type:complete